MIDKIKTQIKKDMEKLEMKAFQIDNEIREKFISKYPKIECGDYLKWDELKAERNKIDIMWQTLQTTYKNILYIEEQSK